MANKKNSKAGSGNDMKSDIAAAAVATKSGGMTMQWKLALVLGVLSFLLYANTLKNGFVYDDQSAITKNTIVAKGISAIPEILSTPYRLGYWVVPNDTYRPLSLVLFAIEYQFFGKEPAAGHFVNLLLYAACVMLLFLFLDRFLNRKKTVVAFLAALLFALHPLHTEVVANIKSSDELLCFQFAFLSLNVFSGYAETGKTSQLVLGALCFLLSLMAKETVISFYAVICMVFLFYTNSEKKRGLAVSAGAGVAVTVFMLVRYAVLSKYHADQFAAIPFLDNALVKADLPFASRIASAFYILGYYIRLLVVPYPLIMDYSYDHFPFVTMANPVALLSLLAYLGLIIYGLRLFLKDRRNPYAFCILYFLITLSLYSNTFMLIAATLGERFLFFPSVGFCLAVALLLERWAGNAEGETGMLKSPKVWGVMVPVGLIFAVITVNRNTEWQDNYTLFTTDVQKAPRSVKLNYLAGVELLNLAKEETNAAKQQKGSQDGIAYLNKAVAIYPDYDDAQAELCGAYYRMGRYDSAEVHGKISLKLNPANAVTLNNMGGLFFVKKDYRKTIELCEQAIHLQPGYVDMYTNVAASFLSLGVTDSGLHYLYQAINVDPDFKTTYVFLATAYRAAGKADSAQKYESIAKKLM